MARTVVARAPGRVNLIGEHTDYNDGFVLPMALPFATTIEATARGDRRVSLRSEGFEPVEFTLDDDPRSVPSWARYVAGMIAFLAEAGVVAPGFDASVSTDIPIGASLSSSAALEVATGFAASALAGVEPDPVLMARLGQRVENEVVGIRSGIMDQLISAIAIDGTVTEIDCRDLSTRAVHLPAEVQVVIMDTMTRRKLAESEYDRRRDACERAAAEIGVASLRDASLEEVLALPDGEDRRRAHHVVTENARVLDMVDALDAGDVVTAGRLMNASHESLDVDYEVSSPALNAMVGFARTHAGCLGARMTGGGFAGSAVAMVRTAATEAFCAHVRGAWADAHGEVPDVWAVAPSAGASVRVVAD